MIDAVVKDVPKDQELFYIIQANKQRHKNSVQVCNEIDALWDYYQLGKTNGRPKKGASSTHPNGKTRDLVAADLGISNKTIQMLRFIKNKRADILQYIGTSITLQAAYGQVKLFENQKDVLRTTARRNGKVNLNGGEFSLYTKSSADMCELDDESIDHIVTSPPYMNQRQFQPITGNGHDRELGQEESLEEYIDNLLKVIEECRRVMRATSSLMLNMGDTYYKASKMQVPERVSIAIQDRLGLKLRNTLIWAKNSSMCPESTKRRRHTDYEYVYHFVKDTDQYYYNADPIRIAYGTNAPVPRKPPRHYNHEIAKGVNARWVNRNVGGKLAEPVNVSNVSSSLLHPLGKIPGCVLEISRHTTPLDMEGEVEHTAAFPDRLVRELLKPIAQPGDIILDPFGGSHTTGAVALEYGCFYVGYDTNAAFNRIGGKRLSNIKESAA
jgi:site-specific DNA-methyltransferase (adenine-specific)